MYDDVVRILVLLGPVTLLGSIVIIPVYLIIKKAKERNEHHQMLLVLRSQPSSYQPLIKIIAFQIVSSERDPITCIHRARTEWHKATMNDTAIKDLDWAVSFFGQKDIDFGSEATTEARKLHNMFMMRDLSVFYSILVMISSSDGIATTKESEILKSVSREFGL